MIGYHYYDWNDIGDATGANRYIKEFEFAGNDHDFNNNDGGKIEFASNK